MSEPAIAAAEALAAPLLKDAEQALAPEAAIALQDLHSFVTSEMDQLRADLPTLVGQGVEHLQNLGAELLNRYHGVIAKIEAHLGMGTPAPAALPQQAGPTIPVPSDGTPSAVGIASNPVGQPVEQVQAVAVDPTPAPSTTEASSAPSSTPSTSATTTPETPTA